MASQRAGRRRGGSAKTATQRPKPGLPAIRSPLVERLQELLGLALVAAALFVLFCLLLPNATGPAGRFLHHGTEWTFGWARFLLPLLIALVGLEFIIPHGALTMGGLILTLGLFEVMAASILHLVFLSAPKGAPGGVVGNVVVGGLTAAVGPVGASVLLFTAALIDVLIITKLSLKDLIRHSGSALIRLFTWLFRSAPRLSWRRHQPLRPEDVLPMEDIFESELEESAALAGEVVTAAVPAGAVSADSMAVAPQEAVSTDSMAAPQEEPGPAQAVAAAEAIAVAAAATAAAAAPPGAATPLADALADAASAPASAADLEQLELFPGAGPRKPPADAPAPAPPPLITYHMPTPEPMPAKAKGGKPGQDDSALLEETLASFGVSCKVVHMERGPTVTRYEIQPAKGVKVSKFTTLSNDIALALAAHAVRIEAPVPGKSVIGIEIPNARIEPVSLRDILQSEAFQNGPVLSLALGKDITGRPVVGDLTKMPHLLIAGATGSGKSVCLLSIIASMLYKASPAEVQFVIVDPKRVDLSVYEGIPHCINVIPELPPGMAAESAPPLERKVLTDVSKTPELLKKITEMMDRRYRLFEEVRRKTQGATRASNIKEFNAYRTRLKEMTLPYVVLIIDELADLMMMKGAEVERYLCRLAQLGRAAGIHVILATQRPSVDVITGLIKANFPSRIAFAVSSQTDSRTILDGSGAEKLLGRGDMLYKPIDAPEARRVQGAFIGEGEIRRLVEWWTRQPEPANLEEIHVPFAAEKSKAQSDEGEDELLEEALVIVRSLGQASVSILQRKLKIGYARAGRLIDVLETRGFVGPADGSKPRKVLG